MNSTGKEGGRVAALYIRVSTARQAEEGYSLAAQKRTLTEWAEQHGYEPAYYEDAGKSAKDIMHRPEMLRLIEDAKKGRIQILMVWALSRSFRSVADLCSTQQLLASYGVGFASYTESFDATTPTGRLIMYILGAVAQMEREVTAERVALAMEERALQGKRTCSCVLGYDLAGADSLVPNPAEAKIVQYIFAKYLEHKSLSAVAELCRIQGYQGKRGRIMTAWSVRLILTRAIYAGYNSWRGQLIRGQHEPLVTLSDYNRVQGLLAKATTGRKAKCRPREIT